ncbi:MAG TPA: RpiR family transcriptional regulator, partial [Aestuariivirga sp.]|nr:RpiR family transcriptional regulator [Aestuariivirga sp.]
MSAKRQNTVAEKLRMKANDLTAAERKLMAALFADYPVAGLASITEFAKLANVSTPSVLRLAKKLGFSGFPALQEALRGELSAQL